MRTAVKIYLNRFVATMNAVEPQADGSVKEPEKLTKAVMWATHTMGTVANFASYAIFAMPYVYGTPLLTTVVLFGVAQLAVRGYFLATDNWIASLATLQGLWDSLKKLL
jgi:hypothetical protein